MGSLFINECSTQANGVVMQMHLKLRGQQSPGTLLQREGESRLGKHSCPIPDGVLSSSFVCFVLAGWSVPSSPITGSFGVGMRQDKRGGMNGKGFELKEDGF